MTKTFEVLKSQLEAQGNLSIEEVNQAVAEHGKMTDDEALWLEAERHKSSRAQGDAVTMDQYLAALQTVESAAPGSPEHEEAQRIIEAFESGG
jgi:hypothetical protein